MKKFFTKLKFRSAGPGHSLIDSDKPAATNDKKQEPARAPVQREQTPAQKAAAQAAMARFSQNSAATAATSRSGTHTAFIRKSPTPLAAPSSPSPPSSSASSSSSMPPTRAPANARSDTRAPPFPIFYSCSLCDLLLERESIQAHTLECMRGLAEDDAVLCAVMDLYSNNRVHPSWDDDAGDEPTAAMPGSSAAQALQACVETILKYLDNIVANPSEPKYRKIRLLNKSFAEKVASVAGAVDVFLAIGFKQEVETPSVAPSPQQQQGELFLVLDASAPLSTVQYARECLSDGAPKPPKPLLYRDTKIYKASGLGAPKFELPDSFYELTKYDLKSEQARKREELESSTTLKTKAMREEEKRARARVYDYACIRFRLPDGALVQMLFETGERVSALSSSFAELLKPEFAGALQLFQPLGDQETDFDSPDFQAKALRDTKLAPAALVNVRFSPAGGDAPASSVVLKEEALAQMVELPA